MRRYERRQIERAFGVKTKKMKRKRPARMDVVEAMREEINSRMAVQDSLLGVKRDGLIIPGPEDVKGLKL